MLRRPFHLYEMPSAAPNSLGSATYADLLAYVSRRSTQRPAMNCGITRGA
jgi:hypothetical protein